MLRRKETVNYKEGFWSVVDKVSDANEFKHMNIALYCISEGLQDTSQYYNAIEQIGKMDKEQRNQLHEYWSNIDIVGETESHIAIGILESVNYTR